MATPTKSSRILPAIAAFAGAFAAPEVEAANPYVKKALDELPGDMRSVDPISAFVHTFTTAFAAMKADPAVTPSLTGLLGSTAGAVMAALAAYNAAG